MLTDAVCNMRAVVRSSFVIAVGSSRLEEAPVCPEQFVHYLKCPQCGTFGGVAAAAYKVTKPFHKRHSYFHKHEK